MPEGVDSFLGYYQTATGGDPNVVNLPGNLEDAQTAEQGQSGVLGLQAAWEICQANFLLFTPRLRSLFGEFAKVRFDATAEGRDTAARLRLQA